jgi:hypothetical protein
MRRPARKKGAVTTPAAPKPFRVPETAKRGTLHIKALPNESRGEALARVALAPSARAAGTLNHLSGFSRGVFSELTLQDLVGEFEKLLDCAEAGLEKVSRPRLIIRGILFDEVSHDLIRRAYARTDSLPVFSELLRLAFRAGAQSRADFEAQSLIENPRGAVAFVRAGAAQVNIQRDASRAQERLERDPQTQISSEARERLGAGAMCEAGGRHPSVEALALGDGTQDTRGQETLGHAGVQGRPALRAARPRTASPRASKANGEVLDARLPHA